MKSKAEKRILRGKKAHRVFVLGLLARQAEMLFCGGFATVIFGMLTKFFWLTKEVCPVAFFLLAGIYALITIVLFFLTIINTFLVTGYTEVKVEESYGFIVLIVVLLTSIPFFIIGGLSL